MRAVVQRVSRAEVREVRSEPGEAGGGGELLGEIGRGLCVLLGIGAGDGEAEADFLADKVAGLRIFPDPPATAGSGGSGAGGSGSGGGKDMNRSLSDIGGAILVVSQFTLYGDASRGRRPSFTGALAPDRAEPLYEYFVGRLRSLGHRVATGRFGAMMAVALVNDGPVTLWLDTASLRGGERASERANDKAGGTT